MKVIRVWEFPIRLIHWSMFLAIVGLCITGTYIHWPFLAASTHTVPAWTFGYGAMGFARMVHLICGWTLMLCLIGRFLWGIIGNKYASLANFLPFLSSRGRAEMMSVFRYYLFMQKTPGVHHKGHNAVALVAYLGFFSLMAFQVITGFALFGQYDPAGTAFQTFGWVFEFASNGYIRLAHYFVMFLVFAFVINHIYAMWVCAIAERDGGAGSMFSGNKFTYKDRD